MQGADLTSTSTFKNCNSILLEFLLAEVKLVDTVSLAEFKENFPAKYRFQLGLLLGNNFRDHKEIVELYNHFLRLRHQAHSQVEANLQKEYPPDSHVRFFAVCTN